MATPSRFDKFIFGAMAALALVMISYMIYGTARHEGLESSHLWSLVKKLAVPLGMISTLVVVLRRGADQSHTDQVEPEEEL